ncbi:MAG TPA: hypothetical protein VMR73_01675 [Candidatus Paceibacterota bacterium]|nr:hypothetical protein [Candidatus Paceibacterota bacterium]
MKTLIFALLRLLFLVLILIVGCNFAIVEWALTRKARIQSQKKSEIARSYEEASRAYYKAFDAYSDALAENDPWSEEVLRLRGYMEMTAEVHEYFLQRLTTA